MKRLERARMLHNVISAKLPQLKEDDLRKMSIEWVLGLLDATFPLETSLVDADCADHEKRQQDGTGDESEEKATRRVVATPGPKRVKRDGLAVVHQYTCRNRRTMVSDKTLSNKVMTKSKAPRA